MEIPNERKRPQNSGKKDPRPGASASHIRLLMCVAMPCLVFAALDRAVALDGAVTPGNSVKRDVLEHANLLVQKCDQMQEFLMLPTPGMHACCLLTA